MTKVCTKCKEEKDESGYHRKRNGTKSICKVCSNAAGREWYENNKERRAVTQKQWSENNKERKNETRQAWRERNREHERKKSKERYDNNPEARRESIRKWRKNNIEKARELSREWRYRNLEHSRKMSREYRKWRYENDLDFRLYDSIRCMIRRVLISEGASQAEEVVGYTTDELKNRLEFNFEPGMSWDNYGEWEIDHVIPIDYFKKKGEMRPHIINALSNLRPMWMGENRSKSNTFVPLHESSSESSHSPSMISPSSD